MPFIPEIPSVRCADIRQAVPGRQHGFWRKVRNRPRFWNLLSQLRTGTHIGAELTGQGRMAELLIVYHSRTGGSRQMAEAAAGGARGECETTLLTADRAGPDDLLRAGGYLFCGPENLAALSGLMKEFFDRCYYPVLGRIEGRPYAQMICAGSDGENAARQLARIATGWRLKEVQPPMIVCTHAQSPEAILADKTIPKDALAQCRDLGQAMAAGLAMGAF